MSITVVEDKGVTVVTVASDSNSMLPPLCQILWNLCYSPACCSVRKGLLRSSVVPALATVQIMVGLFNIGLGPGRISHHPDDFAHLGVAYWLGGVYILIGIITILADRFASVCSVSSAVCVNIIGAIVSIAGIVLYAIDLGDYSIDWMCDRSWRMDSIPSSNDNCRYVAYYFLRLLTAMDITMIVLVVLQLAVCIGLSAVGISALLRREKNKGDIDVETYKPLLTKDLMASPSA